MNDLKPESKFFSISLLIASIVGLYAAAKLVLEKISFWQQKAEGTEPVLGCDISPVVGCGPVINTDQASIFGNIPNPLIGVIAWSILAAAAVLMLSGITLKKWHYIGMLTGAIFGIVIVTYLQYQSIYNLRALCPYCMVTWAVTIPTFWLILHKFIRIFNINKLRFIVDYTPAILILHYCAVMLAAWLKFGSTIFA